MVRFVFFGNYFVGLLAVALAVESSLQLGLPLLPLPFYILLFCLPVVYYNYAYIGSMPLRRAGLASVEEMMGQVGMTGRTGLAGLAGNPRTVWMQAHRRLIQISQWIMVGLVIVLGGYLLLDNLQGVPGLPVYYWGLLLLTLLVALLYYGLLPGVFFRLKLRNTGWLKPFMIGFVWACTVGVLPLVFLVISGISEEVPPGSGGLTTPGGLPGIPSFLWIWLFIKNWMFCTVNAIMFDIKDYEVDMNQQLKTFVVRIGIHRTIACILLPLLSLGLASFLVFAYAGGFSPIRVILNTIPFLLTIAVAFLMYRRKDILFYLIVIDGLLLVKAFCGSLAVVFG